MDDLYLEFTQRLKGTHSSQKLETNILSGLVWLFHVSAIVGIYLGYEQWFLEKTPFNLVLSFILLILAGGFTDGRDAVVIYVFFAAGLFVEWLGTTTGFPFGNYFYGENLGPKAAGVPYLIGINWAMLVLITGTIASQITRNKTVRVLIGASLMVFLDLFIEPNAEKMDFWYWEASVIPFSNYVAWFVIAAVLHGIFQGLMQKLNFKFSLHLYLAQLVFFISLYVHSLL